MNTPTKRKHIKNNRIGLTFLANEISVPEENGCFDDRFADDWMPPDQAPETSVVSEGNPI